MEDLAVIGAILLVAVALVVREARLQRSDEDERLHLRSRGRTD